MIRFIIGRNGKVKEQKQTHPVDSAEETPHPHALKRNGKPPLASSSTIFTSSETVVNETPSRKASSYLQESSKPPSQSKQSTAAASAVVSRTSSAARLKMKDTVIQTPVNNTSISSAIGKTKKTKKERVTSMSEYSSDDDDARFMFDIKQRSSSVESDEFVPKMTVGLSQELVSSMLLDADDDEMAQEKARPIFSRSSKTAGKMVMTEAPCVSREIIYEIQEPVKEVNKVPLAELSSALQHIIKTENHPDKLVAHTSGLLYAYLKSTNAEQIVPEGRPSLQYLMSLFSFMLEHAGSRESIIQSLQTERSKLMQEKSMLQRMTNDPTFDMDAIKELIKLDQQRLHKKSETAVGPDRPIPTFSTGSIQTMPYVDEMALEWKRKHEELEQQYADLEEKSKRDLDKSKADFQKKIKNLEGALKEKEEELEERTKELDSFVSSASQAKHEFQETHRANKHLQTTKKELELRLSDLEKELEEKESAFKALSKEKMELFKQFRALNKLYDNLKDKQENVDDEKTSLSAQLNALKQDNQHLKDKLKHRENFHESTLNELKSVKAERDQFNNDLQLSKQELSTLRQKEVEHTSTGVRMEEKVKQLKTQLDALMKFPDISMNEQEYYLAVTAPDFDRTVEQYIQANNMRIVLLEKKNTEYRQMRQQHAYIHVKKVPQSEMAANKQINHPTSLWDAPHIKQAIETIRNNGYVDASQFNSRLQTPKITYPKPSAVPSNLVPSQSIQAALAAMPQTMNVNEIRPSTASVQSGTVPPRPVRSALSAGRRGLVTPKTVTWEEDF